MGSIACSRRSDSGARAKNKVSERAGKKTRGDWWRGRGNAYEINFKKPMPPSLDRRQRQRNMNPRSGQSKQESYVIMLTEIGFSRVWRVGKNTGDGLRNLTCRMDIAKFSAIRKRKCHLHYWTNKGNENHRRFYIHIGLSNWWIESFSLCDGMNFVVFIDCDGYDMSVVVLSSTPSTAGFHDFHK